MTTKTYDAIVLGAGGVGSAALWRLARRGLRVLGIDRFEPPHDRGSSHGQTRIIRQAYFEHSDYVPLLLAIYRLWAELEQATGQELLRETGLLQVGASDGVVVPGVLQAAALHGLDVERLSPRDIMHRWPAFRVPDGAEGVFERRGGLLHVEKCVEACLAAATAAGAELVTNAEVHGWSLGSDVTVQTSRGEFRGARLVIAAGAWAGPLLSDLNLRLRVRRKVLLWYDAPEASVHADANFPCYLFELPHGVFYGFPAIDQRGLKVGDHFGGDLVKDPLAVDRQLHASDSAPVDAFLQAHIPVARTPCREHVVCLYTMSPDEHFIVDRYPADGRVVFAAGLSGHGFKFAPLLGEVLADLAIEGRTPLPVDFLSAARFQ